ncbi:MAG TPA: hypothetical protein EYP04_08405 [Anaerolineae bacterium]|nr:hypothetical protein [Anaerolineae bacterium]HIQ04784.1 hypothetical protein [Anaerolineae bacterium]
MPDVLTCGELLIDFVPTVAGLPLIDTPGFLKAPGGAPANVAVGLARLGVSSGFLGKVGDDPFGHFLARTLQENGVDTSGLHFDQETRTALAFVSLTAGGERDFLFYRHPSADMRWHPNEVDADYVRQARVFHYGSISLIDEPSRSATLTALEYAQEAGLLCSYDPNLRLPLWPSAETARAGILLGWQHADLIKVSEEELVFITGLEDEAEAVQRLWSDRLRLVVITRGAGGSAYAVGDGTIVNVPGFQVPTVDTTGAGDGFVAGLLAGLLERGLVVEEDVLPDILCFANAVGALTTTAKGAIPSLPTRDAVNAFLQRGKRATSNE